MYPLYPWPCLHSVHVDLTGQNASEEESKEGQSKTGMEKTGGCASNATKIFSILISKFNIPFSSVYSASLTSGPLALTRWLLQGEEEEGHRVWWRWTEKGSWLHHYSQGECTAGEVL